MNMKSDLFSSIYKLHSNVYPKAIPLLPVGKASKYKFTT